MEKITTDPLIDFFLNAAMGNKASYIYHRVTQRVITELKEFVFSP